MIQANELRLGNWVSDTMSNEFVQVETVTRQQNETNDDFINFWTSNGGYCEMSLENVSEDIEKDKIIQPIPLTEEILLKCGFEKDVDGSLQKNDVSIFLDKRFKTNLYLQTNDSDRQSSWFGYECKISTLHQLQNLYFALTNQELNIEL